MGAGFKKKIAGIHMRRETLARFLQIIGFPFLREYRFLSQQQSRRSCMPAINLVGQRMEQYIQPRTAGGSTPPPANMRLEQCMGQVQSVSPTL